jgi:glutathione reductase (NADPH)
VNVGCVPKKVMWHAAGIVEAVHDAHDYGVDVECVSHTHPSCMLVEHTIVAQTPNAT